MRLAVQLIIRQVVANLVSYLIHMGQKEWGYGAAAPPDFGVLHRILIFCNRTLFGQLISPT